MAVIQDFSVYRNEDVLLAFVQRHPLAPIFSSKAGNPVTVETVVDHDLTNGDLVRITDHDIVGVNGEFIATVIDSIRFTVPVETSSNGEGGNFRSLESVDISGWTIQFTVRKKSTDPDPPLIQVTAVIPVGTDGRFNAVLTSLQLTLPASKTPSDKTGQYAYDVQRVDVAAHSVLAIGVMTVLQEVRKP